MASIYVIRNTVNDKRYIGQTWETLAERWGRHVSKARRGDTSCRHLYAAIRKYGVESFEITLAAETWSQEQLDQLEKLFILAWHANDRKLGYNLKSGGSAGRHSDETRKRMSQTRKGRHMPGTFPKGVLSSPKPFEKGHRPWNQRFDPPLTPAQRAARYRERLAAKSSN